MDDKEMFVETLKPGDVIQFPNIKSLPAFEDLVADSISPEMSVSQRDAWLGRICIEELLRPPKFHGNFADILLQVMAEPFERLLDANNRGLAFIKNRGVQVRSDEYSKDMTSNCFGFIFTADARSTGRGVIGQVYSELWYLPTPMKQAAYRLNNGEMKASSKFRDGHGYGGAVVRRTVTKPRMEATAFRRFDAEVRLIGFEALRENIQRPLYGFSSRNA